MLWVARRRGRWRARAQPRAIRLIGFIHTTSVSEHLRRAFEQGLREAGFVEGQNIAILYRPAEGDMRTAYLAKELIERGVEVIVTSGGSLSAKQLKPLQPQSQSFFKWAMPTRCKLGLWTASGARAAMSPALQFLAVPLDRSELKFFSK